jgi:excisionase family DNA binding protein
VETITITEAAARLGISTKTARRWVKTGRLAATLEPGEHGPEYRVAVGALTAAQVVEPAPQPQRVAGVATADQAALLRALDSLPSLLATLESMASDLQAARREIAELREQVIALAPANATHEPAVTHEPEPEPAAAPAETQVMETQDASPRRPWWRRWWAGMTP